MKLKNLFLFLFLFAATILYAQKNKSDHTFLGVDVNPGSENTNGLFVNGVYKGYGAERAGIKPGDILKTVNSKQVHSFDELVKTLDNYKPGQQVELSYVRSNSLQKVNASLSDYPEFLKYNYSSNVFEIDSRRAKLGVNVESMWEQYALLVTGFTDNSPAQNAGLQMGDVILKLDNYEFATMEELKFYLSKYKTADVVTLTIKRDGLQKLIKVTLGTEIKYTKETKEKKETKGKKETREVKEKKEIKEEK